MCSPQVHHLWNCKSQLQLREGILYYLWKDPLQDRLLFIVPKGLRQQVLRYCHDFRSSGHLGQEKTISRLKKRHIGMVCQQIADYMCQPVRLATHKRNHAGKPEQN
jgi:hypothetical protein